MLLRLAPAALTLILLSATNVGAQIPPPLPPETLREEVDPAKAAYLRTHEVASGPVQGGLTFRFPTAFYRSRLILLGESHGSAAPQVLDLELLTHLNARIGLRDYLAEVDPLQADLLNTYLRSGDEAPLNRVFSLWKTRDQWGNTAYLNKMKAIRDLNRRLSPARQLTIHGIDAMQDWPLLTEWMADQGVSIDPAALQAEAEESGKARVALAALKGARLSPLRERLRANLERTAAKVGREATLFANYARLVSTGELGARPAYGLWGLFHVMQAKINGAETFALRVKASDLPAGRFLVSLIVLSLDSAVMVPAPIGEKVVKIRLTDFNVDGPIVKVPGASTLRAVSRPNSIQLFDMTALGSPYLTSPDFAAVRTTIGQDFKPDDPKAPATAYAQYVGAFRGSDWAPPLP